MKPMLLMTLALAACTTVPPPLSAQPTAAFGQTASSGVLSVRPLVLLEDSRCPASVQCVWAGQVRIRVEITDEMGRGNRELTQGQALQLDGGTVTLVAVDPPKLAPGTTDAGQYRFTFRFERQRP